MLRRKILFFDIAVNIMIVVTCLVFIFIIYRLFNSSFIKKPSTCFLVLFVIVVSSIFISKLRLGEEKIHFIEYGVLGLLVYRALLPNIKGYMVYIAGLIIVLLIGWGDEIIQYFLPNRVYDIRDVVMNFSGGLIAFVIMFVIDIDRKGLKSLFKRMD